MNLSSADRPLVQDTLLKKKNRTPRTRKKAASPRSAKERTVTVWDQAAAWYDNLVGTRGTDFHKKIILPGVHRLLALKKGSRVLDLACGQGVLSRFLAQKGMKVEGVDASEELIRFARGRSKTGVRYHIGDARDEAAVPENRFDGIACILALQNMEELEPVFDNVFRGLKPGGRFVMVVTHPCFRIPRQSHWGWDEEKKLEYRRVDRYASEISIPIVTPPIATSKVFTLTYHRPLQSYFTALAEAGLLVDGLEEWVSNKTSEPGKRAKAENRARKEIPLFLAIRAVKPQEETQTG